MELQSLQFRSNAELQALIDEAESIHPRNHRHVSKNTQINCREMDIIQNGWNHNVRIAQRWCSPRRAFDVDWAGGWLTDVYYGKLLLFSRLLPE